MKDILYMLHPRSILLLGRSGNVAERATRGCVLECGSVSYTHLTVRYPESIYLHKSEADCRELYQKSTKQ